MKMNKLLYLSVMLFSITLISAQIDNEANFYTSVANANYNKDLVSDYGADNNFATDDSNTLQTAINDISANGGGILTISAGNYSFAEVDLKSNVHLDIDGGVVIRPTDRSDQKNYTIFSISENMPVENVTITSSSGNRFKVDLTQTSYPNVSVFKCKMVTNFILSDFEVDDAETKFSVVTMGGEDYNGVYLFPTNGIVKNIRSNDAHYGYGVVQAQSAENILFKNLDGDGGVTLRMETGFKGLNDLQGINLPAGETRVGGLDNLIGRNISSTNGNCAVMVSPHAMHNGRVDVEGITSVNSGFAVRIESGFVSSKYDQNIGLVRGTFESVRIKDVIATFGNTSTVKPKHYRYYPNEITDPTTESSYSSNVFIGPSIAAILADANYICTGNVKTVVVEEPIVANGFLYQDPIVPASYLSNSCGTLSVKENELTNSVSLFPNPASEYINMKSSQVINVLEIYNISGALVMSIKNIENKKLTSINLFKQPSGMYFVKTYTDFGVLTKKILIE